MSGRSSSEVTENMGWADVLEVIDRLHQARIYPRLCDPSNPACGLKPFVEDPSKRPCVAIAQKSPSHQFPVAQCILSQQKNEKGGGLFLRAQSHLGLLQTVIHYGIHRNKSYGFENLTRGTELQLPWIESISTGELVDDEWRSRMEDTFIHSREKEHHLEFQNALEPKNRKDLQINFDLGNSGQILARDHLMLPLLSDREKDFQFLLVPDAEQSFFCLLLILAEASADAREREAATGNSRSEFLQRWINGDGDHLRSILEDNLDVWSAESFTNALLALGFIVRGVGDYVLTERFDRLCKWLSAIADPVNRSLLGSIIEHGATKSLQDIIREAHLLSDLPVNREPLPVLRSVCQRILEHLGSIEFQVNGKNLLLMGSAATLDQFPNRRFSFSGEYRLRKYESISRNYFATLLDHVSDKTNNTIYVGAFALGTLLDVESLDENGAHPRALRTLLRTLAAFGTELETLELLKQHREQGRMQTLHNVPFAFAVAIEELSRHAECCPVGFEVPTELYLAAMRSAVEARPDKASMMKSMIRLEYLERELQAGKLTRHLFDIICNSNTGIAHKLAMFRLQQTTDDFLDEFPETRVEVVIDDDVPLTLTKFDTSLFIAILVTLLKEAIQHTSIFNKTHTSDAPAIVIVSHRIGGVAITIENPCDIDSEWDGSASNQADDVRVFLGYLPQWRVDWPSAADRVSGRWHVVFRQCEVLQ